MEEKKKNVESLKAETKKNILYVLPENAVQVFANIAAAVSGTEPVQEVEDKALTALNVDRELKELQRRLPKIDDDRGKENAEWCYWRDNTSQALTTTITSAIYGDGIKIISDNEKVIEVLTEFNKKINEENLSIADLIHQSFEDNIMQGISVWFKRTTKKKETLGSKIKNKLKGKKKQEAIETINVIKTDPKEIKKVRQATEGWVKFIQHTFREKQPPTLELFNSDAYDPTQQSEGFEQVDVHLSSDEVVWFDFFRRPPIRSVVHLIVFKMQIAVFMRTAAKKFASPIPLARIGNDENYNPNLEEYQNELNAASQELSKTKNWDAIAYPWNWEIGVLETANKVMDFTAILDWIDKQIARALFGSIALFEASGSELATSKTIERVVLRRIDYFRSKMELSLRPLYEEVLLLNSLEGESFELDWAPPSEENKNELVNAVINMYNSGILEDKNEARKLLSGIFELPEIKEPEFDEDEALPVTEEEQPPVGPYNPLNVPKPEEKPEDEPEEEDEEEDEDDEKE